jgi:hypothetical protein
MTELQASLMAIGGVIVAGVISYNKWQEHKAKKTVERAFSAPTDDVLMRSDSPDSADNDTRDPRDAFAQRREPVLSEPDAGAITEKTGASATEKPAGGSIDRLRDPAGAGSAHAG